MKKLIELWNAETPKVAKFLQKLSVALGGVAIAYSQLPADWQLLIPKNIVGYCGAASLGVAFLLQFFKKSDK
jgi:hypothetical protein